MRKGDTKKKIKNAELVKQIKEAKQDPNFIKELNTFIKASTTIYDLK